MFIFSIKNIKCIFTDEFGVICYLFLSVFRVFYGRYHILDAIHPCNCDVGLVITSNLLRLRHIAFKNSANWFFATPLYRTRLFLLENTLSYGERI